MFMLRCAGAIFESDNKIDGAQVVQSLELQIREKTGWSQPVYQGLYLALQSPLLNKQVRVLFIMYGGPREMDGLEKIIALLVLNMINFYFYEIMLTLYHLKSKYIIYFL